MDTLFSCSRLNAVNSFPLAGHMPPEVKDWYQFEAHLSQQLRAYGLAESIKDLYWDIRPKPEFGTVEIRVCDTPLTVERACQIAALAQALAVLLMREPEPSDKAWLSYRSNHFQACRFGLQGSYVTPDGQRMRLIDHLRALFQRLIPVAEELGTGDMIAALRDDAMRSGNDSRWLRNQFHRLRDLPLVVEAMSTAWRGSNREPAPAELAAVLRRRIRATSEPMAALFGARAGRHRARPPALNSAEDEQACGPLFLVVGRSPGNPCLGGTGVPVRLRRGLPGAAALVAVPVQGLRQASAGADRQPRLAGGGAVRGGPPGMAVGHFDAQRDHAVGAALGFQRRIEPVAPVPPTSLPRRPSADCRPARARPAAVFPGCGR